MLGIELTNGQNDTIWRIDSPCEPNWVPPLFTVGTKEMIASSWALLNTSQTSATASCRSCKRSACRSNHGTRRRLQC